MSQKRWVDFRAVKAAVSMPMALEHYGVNWLRKSGDSLRGRCPIHEGEGDRTFHVSLTKDAFNCFSCGGGDRRHPNRLGVLSGSRYGRGF